MDTMPNAEDARKLLDTIVGGSEETLASVGGTIDRINHQNHIGGDALVYVSIPVGASVSSMKSLGKYGVESIEFYGQDFPEIEGVVVSTCITMETSGPEYTFNIDRTETETEGDR